jgi:hypothetical protein
MHVSIAFIKATEKPEKYFGDSIFGRMESLCRQTQAILDRAPKADDGRLGVRAIRETRETLVDYQIFTSRFLAHLSAEENDESSIWVAHSIKVHRENQTSLDMMIIEHLRSDVSH